MPAFSADQRRDAYATLAGFVYQIDRTVQRWLDLDDRSVLLCEAGEDIDGAGLLDDGVTIDEASARLLEQVKRRRARPLTLTSAEARQVLGEYVAARERNPGKDVRLRYFTNAPVGREKSARFPRGLSGIGAWRQIQAGQFTHAEIAETLRALRDVVGAPPKGDAKTPEQRLAAFLAGASPETFVERLVSPVEWSTENADHPEIRAAIMTRLVADGRAADPEVAASRYEALFVHVIKLLTEPGDKRLDRDGLLKLLAEPAVPAATRALFGRIEHWLAHLRAEVEALAAKVAAVEAEVSHLGTQLPADIRAVASQVATLHGDVAALRSDLAVRVANSAILRAPAITPDEPPALPAVFTERVAYVTALTDALQASHWVGLVGASGIGKSVTARVVANACTGSRWVSLGGPAELMPEHLAQQMLLWHRAIGGDPNLEMRYADGAATFADVVHAIGARAADAIVVLDAVPDLPTQPALLARVTVLAGALRSAGIRVLATTQYPAPAALRAVLGSGLAEIGAQPLSAEETAGLLRAAGAPATAASALADAVFAVTEGHPTLVLAAIAWLHGRAWALDSGAIASLVAGEPLRQTREGARRTLARTVPDQNARSLVDRLSVVGAAFGRAILDAVASAEPAIPAARDRLDAVLGPWVHRRDNGLFEVSPLLADVGEEYLAPDERARVHTAVADAYLSTGELYAGHAFWVCSHFMKASAWPRLVGVLMRIGLGVTGPAEARLVDWLRFLFPPASGWPADFPTGLRILVRSVQVRILGLLGLPVDLHQRDLETLISAASADDSLSVLMARVQNVLTADGTDAGAWGSRALEAARALRRAPAELRPPPADPALAPEGLVWGALPRLQSADDVAQVVGVIASMTEDEREAMLGVESAPQLAMAIMDMAYATEATKPATERDWPRVVETLAEAERIFSAPGAGVLRAAALRARAIVLADYLGDVDGALAALGSSAWASGHARFILDFTEAAILLAKRRAQEAFEAFARVLAFPGIDEYPLVHRDARVKATLAAVAAGRLDEAVPLGAAALRTFRRIEPADPYELPELLAELEWVRWLRGERPAACALLDAAAERVARAADAASERYAEAAIKVGHLAVWMTSVARTGAPPPSPGPEPTTEPFPGLMWARRPHIAGQYPAATPMVLALQTGRAASACGNDRVALRAFRRAVAAAEADGARVMACLLDWERARTASLVGEPAEAIAASVRAFRAVAVERGGGNMDPTRDSTDPDEAWRGLADDDRRHIERFLFYGTVLIPAFARAAASEPGQRPQAVERLRLFAAAIEEHRQELALADEHAELVGRIVAALEGTMRRADVGAWRATLSASAEGEVFTHALCIALVADARPSEVVGAQAFVVTLVANLGADFESVLRALARWIERTARDLAGQGARLSVPKLLRDAVSRLPAGAPSIARAAGLLLTAETATGANYQQHQRARLRELAVSEPTTP